MKHILLTLAYDGTHYHGWQRQKNAVTVQQTVEEAVAKVLGRPVGIMGASRTDTGVHAADQKALLVVESLKIPIEKLLFPINHWLPRDIKVMAAQYVDAGFHPIFDAVKKTYQYRMQFGQVPDPLSIRYSEFVGGKLDIARMAEGAPLLLGKHNFKAFCAAGSTAKTFERTIYDCTFNQNGPVITMSITGNGFLYNMVRIIAGTFIMVGQGKLDPSDISKIILSQDRTLAGKTAAPQGLTLCKIYY